MPPKLIPLLAVVVAVLVVGTAGMFAWDASRSDVIGNGVRVGSVDVSGLTRGEARERLRTRLLAPLRRPLVIRAVGRTFPLTAREAHITANIDAIVSEAVQRGRAAASSAAPGAA